MACLFDCLLLTLARAMYSLSVSRLATGFRSINLSGVTSVYGVYTAR